MTQVGLLLPALKPERIFTSHPSFFIGLALFWSHSQFDWKHTVAVFAYLLFYGAVYLLNDIADYKGDRRDYHNKSRLIASNRLNRKTATFAAVVLIAVTLGYVGWFSLQMLGYLLLLLGINIFYSWAMKGVPYLELLFISFTHPIKYLTALSLCGVAITTLLPYLPFLSLMYFVACFLHAEKQLGKLQGGRKRTFLIGNYSSRGLSVFGNFFLFLAFISLLWTYGRVEFLFAVFVFSIGIWLRFGFSAKNAASFVNKLENLFQPR
ncbi:MAG: UbiA family prenyltransferase [Patescibacteria group bacterium]